MKAIKLCYGIMLTSLFSSCQFNCSVGGNGKVKAKTVTSNDGGPLNGAVISNDIELEVSGIKFKEAYLYDDNENRLTTNEAALGQKIHLALRTDTGWIKENGKSFIGAFERISTATGKVIVDAEDIFKEYETTGIPADKAVDITLSARITQLETGVEDYIVQFRVWDKRGKGEIKGKYKFRIKQ